MNPSPALVEFISHGIALDSTPIRSERIARKDFQKALPEMPQSVARKHGIARKIATKDGHKGLPEKIARKDGQQGFPERMARKDGQRGYYLFGNRRVDMPVL